MGILFDSLVGRISLGLLIAVTLFAVVQTVRVENLRNERVELKTQIESCQATLTTERENRESEREDARDDMDRQTTFCRRERAAAFEAGRSIEGIVDGKNEDGTDRGELVTADELRDVVSEARGNAR